MVVQVAGGILEPVLNIVRGLAGVRFRVTKQPIHEGSSKNCSQCEVGIWSDLGGGFKYVLFSPLFGEDFQFD